MRQVLIIEREDGRKTLPVGTYGVNVRVQRDGFGGAMLYLEHRGMSCPTIIFKLSPDLVRAIEDGTRTLQQLLEET
jgi:hypothetical protein